MYSWSAAWCGFDGSVRCLGLQPGWHMNPKSRIRCFLTARDTGARLTEQPALVPETGEPGLPTVIVNTDRAFQQIEGFGGAFTEASAVNWLALSPARRQQVLEAC